MLFTKCWKEKVSETLLLIIIIFLLIMYYQILQNNVQEKKYKRMNHFYKHQNLSGITENETT